MKQVPFKQFIPGILWFILVLVLICLPQSDLPEMDGWGFWFKKFYFDKWVHAGMFGILAFLFMFPFSKTSLISGAKWQFYLRIGILCSAWGLITEIIQLYIPGRSFDLLDWAADSFGVLLVTIYLRKKTLGSFF